VSSDSRYPRELSEIIEFGRFACRGQSDTAGNAKPLTFPGFTQLSAIKPDEANSSLDGRCHSKKLETEDEGYERMAEAYPKSCLN
jgi:hypothetical protein